MEGYSKAIEAIKKWNSSGGVILSNDDISVIYHQDWKDDDGNCQGGISTGVGFTIAWQRGSLQKEGRNGAFLTQVLTACKARLEHYQSSKFACEENAEALEKLTEAIAALERRRERRMKEGNLGTHKVYTHEHF